MSSFAAPGILQGLLPTPLGARSPVTADAQTWRRELEKAQAGGWFHGPLERVTGDAWTGDDAACTPVAAAPIQGTGTNALGRMDRPDLRMRTHRSCNQTSPGARSPSSTLDAQVRSRPGFAEAASPGGPPTHAGVSATAGGPCLASLHPDAADGGGYGLPFVQRGESAPAPSVRVHVEQGANGPCVWLGIDGDEASVAARATAVLCELQRALKGSSERLAAVVCNGRIIHDGAAGQRRPSTSSRREAS